MAHKANQVILHLGFPKTGTSALQRALFDWRTQLMETHNTLYPGSYENHHYMQGVFSNHPQDLFETQLQGFTNNEEIKTFYCEYRQKIIDEINEKKPARIILSSEHFPELSIEEMKTMRKYLDTLADEIILFVYVRDPWSWSISLRQEQIRTGWVKNETRVDYTIPLRGLIEKIEMGYGQKLIAAPFLRQSDGFDVVEDFCMRFDLQGVIPAGDKYKDIRPGMKREATSLMLKMNQLYPVFNEQKKYIPNPARRLMSEIIQTCDLSRTSLRISRETALIIYDQSKADLKYVDKNYFGGKKVFSKTKYIHQLSDFNDSLSLSTFTLDELAEYLLTCLHSLAKQSLHNYDSFLSVKSKLSDTENLVRSLTWEIEENLHRMQNLIETQKKTVQDLSEQISAREKSLQAVSSELSAIKSSQGWKFILLFKWFTNTSLALKRRLQTKQNLALLKTSSLFNPQWYLMQNPDVDTKKVNPAQHYLWYGGFEGRDPGEDFSNDWYLNAYPDVKKGGFNPLVHYLRFGQKEGRKISGSRQQLAPMPAEKRVGFPKGIITNGTKGLSEDKPEKSGDMRPPVFIFGPPRSGSTFLVEAMNQHELIFITDELRVMSFVNDLFQLIGRAKRMEWNLRGKYRDEFLTLFREEMANLVKRFYQRKMEGLKVIWGDKHPHYADQNSDPGALATICELFPDARFIHIYRHPRQVINSLTVKKWWNFNAAVDLYKSIVTEGRKLGAQVGPERYLEVKYEFLVEHGKETVEQICDFLHIPVSECWLNYMEQQERLRTPYCDPVTEQDLIGKKTVEAFTKKQEKYLKMTLGSLMNDLEYS